MIEEDLPLLARLLDDGILMAAKSVARIPGEAARNALLAPVRKGFVDHDLLEALGKYTDDEVVRSALLDFLREFGTAGGYAVGQVAELLGDIGMPKAVPVLREVREKVGDFDVRRPVLTALVKLGEKEAFPGLIECVAAGADGNLHDWQSHRAGEVLNGIVGRRVYVGSSGPGGRNGNFEEAAAEFRAWWEENEEKLHDDPEWRTWKVR